MKDLKDPAWSAKYLGDLSEQTLANWRWRGIGPRYYRIGGGRIRYDRADLDAWLEENASEPRPAA